MARIVGELDANRVIIASPIALRELVESLVLVDGANVRVDVVPELYEIFIGTVDAIVGDVPLMEISRTTVPRYYAAAKRVIDVLVALVALVVTSPLVLGAAVADRREEGFPVFFSQERVGRNMKPFRIHKLRTMVKDAEETSGPVIAGENDPRITAVGRPSSQVPHRRDPSARQHHHGRDELCRARVRSDPTSWSNTSPRCPATANASR